MNPFDYTLRQQQPPTAAMASGMQLGLGVREIEQQRAAQEAAAAQQAQMNADLAAAARDPGLLPGVMTRYPQLAEKLGHAFKAQTEEQQRAQLQQGVEVASALAAGRPDMAAQRLRDQATAMRNSGDEQGAKRVEAAAQWAEQHPDSLLVSTLATVYSMGENGKRAADGVLALRRAPAEEARAAADARKAGADATSAEVGAKYADRNALADLEAKGWNIKKIQADIASDKERNRIAAINASIGRETNDLKRQELRLKLQEAQGALDEKARGRVAEVESATFAMDNMLNTIERVKGNKSLDDVIGSMEGSNFFPTVTMGTLSPLGDGDERSDAIALIETLGSQAFLSQIPAMRGTGAVSDAEGKKLDTALQSLSRKQSEKQFRANLDEASRLIKKARENVQKRYGVRAGPVDTPAAPGARPPLSSFGG